MTRRKFLSAAAVATMLTACYRPLQLDGKSPKAFIIHGYGATPADHWFPWLTQQLRRHGVATVSVALPDSLYPNFVRWQQTLADTVGMPDEQTILIAHSLGTISLLHYLSRIRPSQIGGLVLVSAFGARIPTLSEIEGFNLDAYIDHCSIDYAAIRRMARRIYLFTADNDSIVPPENTRRLAGELGGELVEIKGGGHFLDRDGFSELPPVWRAVERILMTFSSKRY